jgi:peroxiredoxin
MKKSIIKYSMLFLFVLSSSVTCAQVKVGMKAPEIILNNSAGKEVKLSNFKGQFVLVDFWASWCAPCRKANPNLEALYQKYKGNGFTVLGVSLDSKKESWLKAVKKDKITYPQLNDPAFWNAKAAVSYGIEALPSSFLINKEGVIIAINPNDESIIKFLKL